jgi:hypothetical protein
VLQTHAGLKLETHTCHHKITEGFSTLQTMRGLTISHTAGCANLVHESCPFMAMYMAHNTLHTLHGVH